MHKRKVFCSQMKVNRFKHVQNSPISDFWIKAAQTVSARMAPLDLSDDPVIQERQIWNEVERVCSMLGYDAHYWPENLMVVPVVRAQPSSGS